MRLKKKSEYMSVVNEFRNIKTRELVRKSDIHFVFCKQMVEKPKLKTVVKKPKGKILRF